MIIHKKPVVACGISMDVWADLIDYAYCHYRGNVSKALREAIDLLLYKTK